MDLDNKEWYEALLGDLKAIKTEYGFTERWSRIEGYHSLGTRLTEENDNFKRSEIYGEGVIKQVSGALGMSERTLQYAVQFAQKYPDLQVAPITKDWNWTRVIRELLPDNHIKKDKPKNVCPQCGFVLN